MKRFWLAGLLASAVLSTVAPALAGHGHEHHTASADPVIAAERAFAARHQDVSMKTSFDEFSAAQGVALTPEGVKNIKDYIGTWPDRPKGFIKWWPTLAGIAQSGDLGFTAGPAEYAGGKFYGDYFTIWKKQPDGSWQWLLDQGAGEGGRAAAQPTDSVFAFPASTVAPMDPAAAKADLFAADTALGEIGPASIASAKARYAAEVRLLGYGPNPIDGVDAVIDARSKQRAGLILTREGGDVSQAGDFGYTYGFATWTENGAAMRAPYLRAWQRRASGWVVLAENINPFRP